MRTANVEGRSGRSSAILVSHGISTNSGLRPQTVSNVWTKKHLGRLPSGSLRHFRIWLQTQVVSRSSYFWIIQWNLSQKIPKKLVPRIMQSLSERFDFHQILSFAVSHARAARSVKNSRFGSSFFTPGGRRVRKRSDLDTLDAEIRSLDKKSLLFVQTHVLPKWHDLKFRNNVSLRDCAVLLVLCRSIVAYIVRFIHKLKGVAQCHCRSTTKLKGGIHCRISGFYEECLYLPLWVFTTLSVDPRTLQIKIRA